MMKRVIAIVLCLVTVLLCLTACSHGENDKGAYIRMYLTEPVYDVDPIQAFDNQSTLQVVNLLFRGLFTADEDGKPKADLVEEYEYIEDEEKGEYTLTLTLKETRWSDGVKLKAKDAYYAFYRLINSSHPAKSMLYDIKNARAIAEGNDSVHHLGVTAAEDFVLEIKFEGPVDIDSFLLTLCSPALYPLRDDIIDANPDWGKKSKTIICSGPFMVRSMNFTEKDGFILERNSYFFRDKEDKIDKIVKPYRIVMDYSTTAAEQLALFNSEEAGAYYFFGRIPLSMRKDPAYAEMLEKVKLSSSPSTHVYYLNENAVIDDGGEGSKLFADAKVRKALSLAIDRQKIVEELVYAVAADGLVPHSILNRADRKAEFRKKAESYIAASPNVEEAKQLLKDAGISAGAYSFTITVASYDEDHRAMANLVKTAWSALGFSVSVKELTPTEIIEVIDKDNDTQEKNPTGIYTNPYKDAADDLKYTDENGNTVVVEVLALDLVAPTPNAFHYLAPFATAFSGNMIDTAFDPANPNKTYEPKNHITGYQNATFNEKIEAAFKAEKEADRAALLHEAEGILMEDMPVIPIVYNQDAILQSNKLSKVGETFFSAFDFTKTKLSSYWKIALRDAFVTEETDEGTDTEEVAE